MFVYAIVNSATLKLYIGKTVTRNLDLYLKRKIRSAQKAAYRGRSHLFASMQKHPSTVWSIHPLFEGQTNEEICEQEKALIKALGVQHFEIGYNICDGGEGRMTPLSEETKAKLKLNNPVFQRLPEQEAVRKAAVEKSREERGGTFLSEDSVEKIKAKRAEQDEDARIAGVRKYAKENPEEMSTRMSREVHVLGGRAGSREDKRKAGLLGAKLGGPKARHVRWHVMRGKPNPECPLCGS